MTDPIEEQINRTIDNIISLLYVRRAQLLLEAHNARDEIRAKEENRKKTMGELKDAHANLDTKMRLNPLRLDREGLVKEMQAIENVYRRDIPLETRSEWTCDTCEIEASIARLGRIAEVPVGVPRYETFHTSKFVTGTKGRAPGQLNDPSGLAIHACSNQIYVADNGNGRVEIFSETGEYLNLLGDGQLNDPYGIAIHEDNVYVSCWDHTITKLSVTDMNDVRQRGEYGSGDGQFDYPAQLAIDPTGDIFIADTGNNRICVYSKDLFHNRSIKHKTVIAPFDVKISNDQLYVLCPQTDPCMHVLTLNGEWLRSLITCGRGMNVSAPLFFCFDRLNNFVMSDQESHSIRVFSPEGNLLHKIGKEGHDKGSFFRPQGIAIASNGKLVCVSNNKNYCLQIFC